MHVKIRLGNFITDAASQNSAKMSYVTERRSKKHLGSFLSRPPGWWLLIVLGETFALEMILRYCLRGQVGSKREKMELFASS